MHAGEMGRCKEGYDIAKCSNESTDASKEGSVGANGAEAREALLESHDGLLVQVAVLINFSIEHKGTESLDGEVELVAPHHLGCGPHEVVGPVHIARSMEVAVVINSAESLLEHVGVEEWVQGVTRDAECVNLAGDNTSVLLAGQVLCMDK